VRTVRRFVDEEERAGRKVSTAERHPESAAAEATKKAPLTYPVAEQPSTRVQEEEFAKQLRLARYLAAGGSPPSRPLEPLLRQKHLSEGDLLQRRGLKLPAKKLGRKNWRRRGGVRGGRDKGAISRSGARGEAAGRSVGGE